MAVSESRVSGYSIVVPTYNRPHLLKLLLHYLQLAGAKCAIIIADGSTEKSLEDNRRLIRHYSGRGLRLRHLVPDTPTSFGQRILAGAQLIDTPFAKINADDDAPSVEYMDTAAALLAAEPEVSAVGGYTGTIHIGGDERARTILSVERPAPPPERVEPKAVQRLLRHVIGFSLIYSMQRREHLLTVARGIVETEQADREALNSDDFGLAAVAALEALIDHYLLAAGPVRVIDRMMIGRLYHPENYGKRIARRDYVDLFLGPDFRPAFEPYLRLVIGQVAQSDAISPAQAEDAVSTALLGRFHGRLGHAIAERRKRIWPELAAGPAPSGLRARLRGVGALRQIVMAIRRMRAQRKGEADRHSPELDLVCRAVLEAGREDIG